jgi:hypothetical protein
MEGIKSIFKKKKVNGGFFLEMYELHKEWMEYYANKYWDAIHQHDDKLLKDFDKKQAKLDDKDKLVIRSGSNNL